MLLFLTVPSWRARIRPPRLRPVGRGNPAGGAVPAARTPAWKLAGLGLLSLLPPPSSAQPAEVLGPGLRGDYYDGLNFERWVRTRRDARLDFDWHENSPVPGVPATYFTVRWTGWLVPPVTGRYVLHLTVDDGVRLWLGNRRLLEEWGGQPLGSYRAAVDLRAGRAYPLRVEYCQYSATSRLRFSWDRPRQPEAFGTWRTLWGLTTPPLASNHYREVVPARALVSRWPPAPRPRLVPKPRANPRANPAPRATSADPAPVPPEYPVRPPGR